MAKIWFNRVLLPISFFLAVSAVHASTLSDDLIGNLYLMRSVYQAEYAPSAWKKSYSGYDLETEFNKALTAAQSNPNFSQQDEHTILKNFIYAMKDYHTSIRFVSTEKATLPFSVKGTDDRFFIMYIDRSKLPESSFPFQVGDELVSFGGVPTVQALASVQAETPANVPSTDKALAEIYLTSRSAARGNVVPQGPITIGVKSKGSSTVSEFQLIWNYTPEKVAARGPLVTSTLAQATQELGEIAGSGKKSAAFHPVMSVDLGMDTNFDDNANPYDLGGRKTFTPDLGTKVWESVDSDNFYAYIYKAADRRLVGYIRIPSYEVSDFPKAVAEFARDVALFESTTDALVIDQANNPGGSVFYLYSLASMLTSQPLHTALHRMSITQADVSAALDTIQQMGSVANDADAQKAIAPTDTDGYPASYEFAQFNLNYARFLVNEWNAGRKLTNPFWIAGVDHINPASTHYTKPILLLINHLDFSGGDFFPATMQDNKRVIILGSRTAGAGGYVADIQVANNIGIDKFRCTESIAERINQNPIENLGVTPDIAYEMTVNDFSNNYSGYIQAIQNAVSELISAANP